MLNFFDNEGYTSDGKGGECFYTVIDNIDATFEDCGNQETIIIEHNTTSAPLNHNGHHDDDVDADQHHHQDADLNASFRYDEWGEPIQHTNADNDESPPATQNNVTVKVSTDLNIKLRAAP